MEERLTPAGAEAESPRQSDEERSRTGPETRALSELEPEEHGTIQQIGGRGALRKRLLDMGVVPGAEIEVVRVAPLGDPIEYMVKGYRLSLRRSEAAHVSIELCQGCARRHNCREWQLRQARPCHRRRRRGWLRWPGARRGRGVSPSGQDEAREGEDTEA